MNKTCIVCGMSTVPPSGPKESNVLVIGEFPGQLELETGKPFATSDRFMTAGKIFRKELQRVGISLGQWRTTYLWQHAPTENESCYDYWYKDALEEAKGRSAILLVGSEVVETFTSYKVMDVSGLQVDSPILSAPIIYAMVNPALALHRAVGEVRLGIEKFVGRLEREGLL